MKVLFTHEYVRVSTTYPRSLYRPALCTCCKMAGADETRRLLRQCASSLLSACHRLERGETESSAVHLQTSNATTPNRSASSSSQTNLNATTPNRPPVNASQTSLQSTWRSLILSHLPGKNRLHTPARGNELALYLVETKARLMSEICGHMHSFA